ncbi:MAG TPA: tRNA dihydrouridine(20/20a) synthase DusA [Woeseiaceae bacterium]|nr:tRNA dihydrouridine(20/20a) synthase DusA [Woeseiaceae bacterium]
MEKSAEKEGKSRASKFACAPMMDWTDRHCRYFHRLLSPSALLYTEMVTAEALAHGDADRLLAFAPAEKPVVLQVGGCDPVKMAHAARLGADAGYDAVNINVGCPSDRVQDGQFGACLMDRPELVAECWQAMSEAVDIPVTVKTRLGIDDKDSDGFFLRFVDTVAEAGCTTFIVHARIAILAGLSPKENRTVPPLNHERVYRLKERYPAFEIVINGGITSVAEAAAHLNRVDGVMLGRSAYHTPWVLTELERALGDPAAAPASRHAVVERMLPYIEQHLATGGRLHHVTRHMIGLFAGCPGAKQWRRTLSENAHRHDAGVEVVEEALTALPRAA